MFGPADGPVTQEPAKAYQGFCADKLTVQTKYTLTYDTENGLSGYSGGVSASFVYDGDNKRVKATIITTTTAYVGDYYEVVGRTVQKYYYLGGKRVAMRDGNYLYRVCVKFLASCESGRCRAASATKRARIASLVGAGAAK